MSSTDEPQVSVVCTLPHTPQAAAYVERYFVRQEARAHQGHGTSRANPSLLASTASYTTLPAVVTTATWTFNWGEWSAGQVGQS